MDARIDHLFSSDEEPSLADPTMEENDIIEIIGRDMIKPSSPTPSDLKTYRLCWFNQTSARIYIPIILFYHKSSVATDIHSSNLKKSLAETLNKFYMFAGTIKKSGPRDGTTYTIKSVDCNDNGVIFLEAKLKCTLLTLLENPKAQLLDRLFPDKLQWNDTDGPDHVLLAVQVNYFDCGGFAISACLSHKVADLATTINFLQYWAAISKCGGTIDHQLYPHPDLSKAEFLFPVVDPVSEVGPDRVKCITRRYVFESSKISALKTVVAGEVENPSRVEVVTALLYKCAISASSKRRPKKRRRPTILLKIHYFIQKIKRQKRRRPSTVLIQTVNLRKRIVPPLADNTVGSLIWFFKVPPKDIQRNKKKIGLCNLVLQMKDSLKNFCNNIATELNGKNWLNVIKDDDNELDMLFDTYRPVGYSSSSWCKFPIYEVDFGWGNPLWVSVPSFLDTNMIILMDNKSGDGIEAYISLKKKEMTAFECDEELLAYANPNPKVVVGL